MMCYVERVALGRLGASANSLVVRSVRSTLENPPWKNLESLQHAVDASCLRTAYLGASIAPFRVHDRPEAVIPVNGTTVLDSRRAESRGLHNTADWLRECEQLWDQHSSGGMSFREQLDYRNKLSDQFPIATTRVAYAASGSQVAAVLLRDPHAIIEHSLYWASVETEEEGHFLTALLNSEAIRRRVEHMQSRGEQGARHFDKLFFTLPIPRFQPGNDLHQRLATAGSEAEAAAARVAIAEGDSFVEVRTAIRAALRANESLDAIDSLVNELLGDAGLEDRAAPTGDEITLEDLRQPERSA